MNCVFCFEKATKNSFSFPYSGYAFVLFRKDAKLYEVNDYHCSCYGLRDWDPEETTKEALLLRDDDYGVWEVFGDELKEIIRKL